MLAMHVGSETMLSWLLVQASYDCIHDGEKYVIQQRGRINIKGKGHMVTYLISSHQVAWLLQPGNLEQAERRVDKSRQPSEGLGGAQSPTNIAASADPGMGIIMGGQLSQPPGRSTSASAMHQDIQASTRFVVPDAEWAKAGEAHTLTSPYHSGPGTPKSSRDGLLATGLRKGLPSFLLMGSGSSGQLEDSFDSRGLSRQSSFILVGSRGRRSFSDRNEDAGSRRVSRESSFGLADQEASISG
jgi:hypothetical protein